MDTPTCIKVQIAPMGIEARLNAKRVDRELKRVGDRANWKQFGTIGFEAYKVWILNQHQVRG